MIKANENDLPHLWKLRGDCGDRDVPKLKMTFLRFRSRLNTSIKIISEQNPKAQKVEKKQTRREGDSEASD